jgi:uncharacterized protein YutE (UPF0331/DUF86 family)
MGDIDLEKLRRKIQFVRDSVRQLEDVRAEGREAFLASSVSQAAATRWLQVAIEAIIDAANHVIAREGLGIPTTYQESLDLLIQHGVLARERQETYRQMVRFRNRAVHLYAEITPAEIYGILESHMGDLEEVVSALAERYFKG